MPSIEWNRSWSSNLQQFKNGELPGTNYGDQWGNPSVNEVLKTVVKEYIYPYTDETKTVLEIGSGGGRWTQYFLKCNKIYCVDLNQEMLDYISDRYCNNDNLKLIKTDGTNLPGISENSIDFLFTFGTFVHLDFYIIEEYMKNIKNVMKNESYFSIQFSNKSKKLANENPDFSDNSPRKMNELLLSLGFKSVMINDHLLPHSTIISGKYSI